MRIAKKCFLCDSFNMRITCCDCKAPSSTKGFCFNFVLLSLGFVYIWREMFSFINSGNSNSSIPSDWLQRVGKWDNHLVAFKWSSRRWQWRSVSGSSKMCLSLAATACLGALDTRQTEFSPCAWNNSTSAARPRPRFFCLFQFHFYGTLNFSLYV